MAQQAGQRRVVTLASAVLYSLVVVAILGGLNYLAKTYNKSFDSTANKKFSLSEQSEKIGKNLKQDVTITYWGQTSSFQGRRAIFWIAIRICPARSTSSTRMSTRSGPRPSPRV